MNYSFGLSKSEEIREQARRAIPHIQKDIDWFVDNGTVDFENLLHEAMSSPKYSILFCRVDGEFIPFYSACDLSNREAKIEVTVNGPINGSRAYVYGSMPEACHNFFRDEGFRAFISRYKVGSPVDPWHEHIHRNINTYQSKIIDSGQQSKTYVADLTVYTPT